MRFAIRLQSLQSEWSLIDTWKVVLVSKCHQGQSFNVLYAICIKSFCDRIFTAIRHNFILTLSFWTRDNFFQNFVLLPDFFTIFLHSGPPYQKKRQCVTGALTGHLKIEKLYILNGWVIFVTLQEKLGQAKMYFTLIQLKPEICIWMCISNICNMILEWFCILVLKFVKIWGMVTQVLP